MSRSWSLRLGSYVSELVSQVPSGLKWLWSSDLPPDISTPPSLDASAWPFLSDLLTWN